MNRGDLSNREREQSSSTNRMFLWIVIGVGIVGLLVVALLALPQVISPPLSAEELTRRHVDDTVDEWGEVVARHVLLGAPGFVKELGGEYVEDRIHEVVKWNYSESTRAESGLHHVMATAYVSFGVDITVPPGTITASLPFLSTVDQPAQRIMTFAPQPTAASVDFDFPGLEAVEEKAKEVSEAVGDAVGQATDIKEMAESGDCLEAARAAGVPDNIMSLLEKPSADRGGLEQRILKAGLEAAGLTDSCAELLK